MSSTRSDVQRLFRHFGLDPAEYQNLSVDTPQPLKAPGSAGNARGDLGAAKPGDSSEVEARVIKATS